MAIYVPQAVRKWHVVGSPCHSLTPSMGCSSWINPVQGLTLLLCTTITMEICPHHLEAGNFKTIKTQSILYKKYTHKTFTLIRCSILTSEPDLGNCVWSLLTCSSRSASQMIVNLFLADRVKALIFLWRNEEEQPNILAVALTVKPWLSSPICSLVMSRAGLPRLP